jgi:hypothetical protein
MEWAVLVIVVVGAGLTYVVWQGMRATRAYRELAAAGDITTIREIIDGAIEEWRSGKPPKDVAPSVWHGVQTMEVTDVGTDYVQVACNAEGQYRLAEGRWQEVQSPLQEAMGVAAKTVEVMLYEVPNFRVGRIQVDVYTTYRDATAGRRQRILTCTAHREDARQVDWEGWTAEEIVRQLGARYQVDEEGRVLPLGPDETTAMPAHGRRDSGAE